MANQSVRKKMKKLRIYFSAVFIFCVLSASSAQACICTELSTEVIERVKSKTAYAGIVEVLDIQKKKRNKTIFYLDAVSRRAGDIEGKFKIVKTVEDSCDWAPIEKGFYEVIISRRDNAIQFAGRCLHIKDFIRHFEDNPVVFREDYPIKVEECKKAGGMWAKERERLQCIHSPESPTKQ